MIDPDRVKEYCNYVVNTTAEENKDFIIASHPLWRYLNSIYPGKDIKRYVISINDDSDQTAVEIRLKRVSNRCQSLKFFGVVIIIDLWTLQKYADKNNCTDKKI